MRVLRQSMTSMHPPEIWAAGRKLPERGVCQLITPGDAYLL